VHEHPPQHQLRVPLALPFERRGVLQDPPLAALGRGFLLVAAGDVVHLDSRVQVQPGQFSGADIRLRRRSDKTNPGIVHVAQIGV
jgi:hypothetical protein